jgi:hypothetical protein
VFAGHVDALCARAEELRDDPDPGEALVVWLRAVLAHAAANRGLGTALLAALDEPGAATDVHGRIVAAGDALLDRARRAGAVRDGVPVTDLLHLANAISAAAEGSPGGPQRAERLLDLALDGIRPRG